VQTYNHIKTIAVSYLLTFVYSCLQTLVSVCKFNFF